MVSAIHQPVGVDTIMVSTPISRGNAFAITAHQWLPDDNRNFSSPAVQKDTIDGTWVIFAANANLPIKPHFGIDTPIEMQTFSFQTLRSYIRRLRARYRRLSRRRTAGAGRGRSALTKTMPASIPRASATLCSRPGPDIRGRDRYSHVVRQT